MFAVAVSSCSATATSAAVVPSWKGVAAGGVNPSTALGLLQQLALRTVQAVKVFLERSSHAAWYTACTCVKGYMDLECF